MNKTWGRFFPGTTSDAREREDTRPFGPTRFPPIRVGGGRPKTIRAGVDRLQAYRAGGAPVSIENWSERCGTEGAESTAAKITDLMCQSVSDATKHNYKGQFRQWAVHRSLNGLNPYVGENNLSFVDEEASVMAYLSLSLGPLGKDPSTMNGHLCAVGYFHRLRFGSDPLTDMNRLQLTIKGTMRNK